MWHISSVDAGGEEAGGEAWTWERRSEERRGGSVLRWIYVNIFQQREEACKSKSESRLRDYERKPSGVAEYIVHCRLMFTLSCCFLCSEVYLSTFQNDDPVLLVNPADSTCILTSMQAPDFLPLFSKILTAIVPRHNVTNAEWCFEPCTASISPSMAWVCRYQTSRSHQFRPRTR